LPVQTLVENSSTANDRERASLAATTRISKNGTAKPAPAVVVSGIPHQPWHLSANEPADQCPATASRAPADEMSAALLDSNLW
jgi:hypothetical protein